MPVANPIFSVPSPAKMPRLLRVPQSPGTGGTGPPVEPKTSGVLWPIQRPSAG